MAQALRKLSALALLPVLALFLAGCDHRAEDAASGYDAMEQSHATKDQLCIAAGNVLSEWQRRGDEQRVRDWTERQQIICNSAAICHQLIGGCPS